MDSLFDFCIEENRNVLLDEWATELNQGLTPQDISPRSSKKIWWRCPEGHTYESAVSTRVRFGRGCPYCVGQRVLQGYNDLASQRPDLAAQWHPNRNETCSPETVTCGSNYKVWWVCEHGHEYQAVVNDRNYKGRGCPYCSGQRVLIGFNDLASQHPELVAQWHPTRNGEVTPQMVTSGRKQKIWWICEKGHEWKTDIRTRTQGSDCPVCKHRIIVPGSNDLGTTHPELAAQWHPTLNDELKPQDVFAGDCRRKVWWVCKKGHEWQATISSRRTADCPYCTGRMVLPGFNDLASVRPDVASRWHPSRNGDLTPQNVTQFCNKKVWWQCSLGHEWQASINDLSARNSGCPYCSGRRVLAGFNDLATIHPAIAAQWHETLNEDLTPQMITSSSHKQVWWRCNEGHVWKAYIFSRTGREKCGCPVCAGKINKKRAEKYRAMLAEVGLDVSREGKYIPIDTTDPEVNGN